ncbi:MAG TPA: glycoside hydrolase family 3 N-terminal domain-containing protein [Telluria sp.]|nr:glycoside hydrolase family 3 N-terminal domain-containing protein [Telluria sp.]
MKPLSCALLLAGAAHAQTGAGPHATHCAGPAPCAGAPAAAWPNVGAAYREDAKIEARVREILAGMTLAQKVGQMTQGEIKTVTPDDVRRYYLGSVLNGGGSWPGGNKHASAADWVALADRYYDASMATDMAVKVPVIWGIDAIHGNSNVVGATLFPHNVGLGAAHDPALVRAIGAAVGRAVRATGIAWVFAPTLAVVQDLRWGRSYESFSSDPALVQSYGSAYVKGLQGRFGDDANVIATAKHFIGDGGTDQGKDRGQTVASAAQMAKVHAQGYTGALGAGALTVMASFNSWKDPAAGIDYGKMHGSRPLLTDLLKERMGFGGFIVSDWNGIAEVPGCREDSCAQAVNAGLDMFMVPDKWKDFIHNTIAQVEAGEIPMSRIDDAVARILRVKLRAGLFGKRPSANAYAGKPEAMQARALARQAVRESLVLLKNEGHVLPLKRGARVLVVGRGADSMPMQNGGWSITWQGTDNTNADFPVGDTILAGIRASGAQVTYSADASGADPSKFDAVIAVVGEKPYAEGDGDIGPAMTLRHTSRYPEDLAVLKAVRGKGTPVATVFLSGRPLYVNDLINMSDSFVAAWLPGTEGAGVADLLFRGRYDFRGRLPFAWPGKACPAPTPLFARGYGLGLRAVSNVPALEVDSVTAACGRADVLPVFTQADRATFPLVLADATASMPLGADLNAVLRVPNASVETAQINTQQDAKRVTWTGPARLAAQAAAPRSVPAVVRADGVLRFDTVVGQAPAGKVTLSMGAATLDATRLFARLADGKRHTVQLPLSCFTDQGANLDNLDTPFGIASDAAWSAAFTRIELAGGALRDPATLNCNGDQP